MVMGSEVVTTSGPQFWSSAAHPQLAHLPQLPHPLAASSRRRHPRVQVYMCFMYCQFTLMHHASYEVMFLVFLPSLSCQ